MNAIRNRELKVVVSAMTVIAAIATGCLVVQDANAAPPKNKRTTISAKRSRKSKPVVVKIAGDRRAAESRARQEYANLQAREQAAVDAANAAKAQDQADADSQIAAAQSAAQPQVPVANGYQEIVPGIVAPSNSGYREVLPGILLSPNNGYNPFGSNVIVGGFSNSGFNNFGNGFVGGYSNGSSFGNTSFGFSSGYIPMNQNFVLFP